MSKSGTNQFHGAASYQVQTAGTTDDRRTVASSQFEEDKDWATLSLGGPVLREHLFFYGSYYRPTVERDNASNAYGAVTGFESDRDEFFGKLSFQPTSSILVNGSYRDSEREDRQPAGASASRPASTSLGDEAALGIATLEGSWVINQSSFLSFKYTDFENETASRPDTAVRLPHPPRRHGRPRRREPRPPGLPAGADADRRPDRLQPVHRAHHRPLRLPPERRADGRRPGRRRPQRHRQRLLPRELRGRLRLVPGRPRHPRPPRRLPALQGRGGPVAASRTAGATSRSPAAASSSTAGRSSTRRGSCRWGSTRRARSCRHPLRVRVAELRDQRHHPLGQLGVQPRPAGEQRRALRPGPAGEQRQRLRLRAGARATSTRCTSWTSRTCSSRGSARSGATTAATRSTPTGALLPGGELAAARCLLGPQQPRPRGPRPLRCPAAT